MNKGKELLIVEGKEFLVERVDDKLIVGGILAVDKGVDFNGMEDLYELISKETGLSTSYIFKIFLKSFRKFLKTNHFSTYTEALNAGFETEGFTKHWEEV